MAGLYCRHRSLFLSLFLEDFLGLSLPLSLPVTRSYLCQADGRGERLLFTAFLPSFGSRSGRLCRSHEEFYFQTWSNKLFNVSAFYCEAKLKQRKNKTRKFRIQAIVSVHVAPPPTAHTQTHTPGLQKSDNAPIIMTAVVPWWWVGSGACFFSFFFFFGSLVINKSVDVSSCRLWRSRSFTSLSLSVN